MNLLLDTHVILWAAAAPYRLSSAAAQLISAPGNALWVSVASLWEVAIKRALNRRDFRIDAGTLRAGLLANGYTELPVEGRHILALSTLPPLHADPFDRLLVAQAISEGMILLTADRQLAGYGSSVRMTGGAWDS